MIERAMGWVFVALGVMALVGVAMGATWHWLTVGMCALMAWCCSRTAREEGAKKE